MRKLSRGQVARIIDAMEPGHRSVYSISREHGITPQWVRVLWRRSGHGRTVPAPGRSARPPPPAGPGADPGLPPQHDLGRPQGGGPRDGHGVPPAAAEALGPVRAAVLELPLLR